MAGRDLAFRPPDPVWAPKGRLERIRAALKAFDPFLDLWWSPLCRFNSPHPGRWVVKEYVRSSRTWTNVMIWEGPNRQYRDEFPIEQMLDQIAARGAGGELRRLSKDLDRKNRDVDEKRELEHKIGTYREAADEAWYTSGQRFGVRQSGLGRSRRERNAVPR